MKQKERKSLLSYPELAFENTLFQLQSHRRDWGLPQVPEGLCFIDFAGDISRMIILQN